MESSTPALDKSGGPNIVSTHALNKSGDLNVVSTHALNKSGDLNVVPTIAPLWGVWITNHSSTTTLHDVNDQPEYRKTNNESHKKGKDVRSNIGAEKDNNKYIKNSLTYHVCARHAHVYLKYANLHTHAQQNRLQAIHIPRRHHNPLARGLWVPGQLGNAL